MGRVGGLKKGGCLSPPGFEPRTGAAKSLKDATLLMFVKHSHASEKKNSVDVLGPAFKMLGAPGSLSSTKISSPILVSRVRIDLQTMNPHDRKHEWTRTKLRIRSAKLRQGFFGLQLERLCTIYKSECANHGRSFQTTIGSP